MHPRSRLTRSIRWSLTLLSLALLTVWLWAGFSFPFPDKPETTYVRLSRGCLECGIEDPTGSSAFGAIDFGIPISEFAFNPGLHLPSMRRVGYGYLETIIPVWIPLMLALSATVVAWMPLLQTSRRERNAAANDCKHCNYDLTANQSGTCPECGAATNISEPVAQAPDKIVFRARQRRENSE